MNTNTISIADLLAAPFAADKIRWKPQVVKAGRALAIAYLDARLVEDRLDAVFGPGGWQDGYAVLSSGDVVCTLRVRIDGEWVEKSDVGGQSEQLEESNRVKGAFSDALKRAAVKLGVGRYLYRIGGQWVDYDEKARKFKQTPMLPEWALPIDKANGVKQSSATDAGNKAGASITAAQWEEIKAALGYTGVAPRVLLNHFAIAKPSDLSASKFAEALRLANTPPKAWCLTVA